MRSLALLLLLLLLVVLVFWPDGGSGGKRGARGPLPGPGTAGAEPGQPASADAPAPGRGRLALAAPAAAATGLQAPFGWQGVVLAPDGAPVAGARVYSESFTTWWEEPPLRAVTAGADGRFFLEWPREEEWDPGDDIVLLAGAEALFARELRLPAPASPPVEVRLALEAAAGRVRILVLDADTGEPVPGVPLHLGGGDWQVRGRTGSDGRVLLAGPAGVGCEVELPAGAAGVLDGPWPIVLPGDRLLEVSCTLVLPPQALRLLARDRQTGTVLAAASFHRLRHGVPEADPMPAEGGLLEWRQPEDRMQVLACEVRAPGHLPVRVHLRRRPPEDPLPVDLPAGAEVPLDFLVLRSGVPVAGATVRATVRGPALVHPGGRQDLAWQAWSGWGSETTVEGATGARGRVRFLLPGAGGRPPEFLELQVEAGAGDTRSLGILDTAVLGPMPWVLELADESATLEFLVTDPAGRSVAGVALVVHLEPVAGSPPLLRAASRLPGLRQGPPVEQEGRSGANGRWRIRVPAPARLAWSAPRLGRAPRVEPRELAAGEVRAIRITTAARGGVTGRVVLADGSPWFGRSVLLYLRNADGTRVQGSTGDQPMQAVAWARTWASYRGGEFRFLAVPPGRYRLQAWPFPLASGPHILVEAGDEDLEVRLAPLCFLGVDLVHGDGRPYTRAARINVFEPGEHWTWYGTDLQGGTGTIRFGPLEQAWLLVEPSGGFADVLVPIGAWQAGTSRERTVTLTRGRTVRLRLAPEELAGRATRIRRAGISEDDARSTILDGYPRNGECSIQAGRDGFTLRAFDAGGEPLGPPLVVPAGQQDLDLAWALDAPESR